MQSAFGQQKTSIGQTIKLGPQPGLSHSQVLEVASHEHPMPERYDPMTEYESLANGRSSDPMSLVQRITE